MISWFVGVQLGVHCILGNNTPVLSTLLHAHFMELESDK